MGIAQMVGGASTIRDGGTGLMSLSARAKFTIYAHELFAHGLVSNIILVGVVECCTMCTTATLNWAVDNDQ